MKIALYPGTFDPITNGHLDIIKRALKLTDRLVIGVLNNPSKNPMFSVEERIEIIKDITKDIGNVEVDSFTGLLVDYVAKKDIDVVVRGLRASTDFEYEFQMAQMNTKLNPDIETIFMMTKSEFSCISSTIVKEIFMFDGSINPLVPEEVVKKMKEKFNK